MLVFWRNERCRSGPVWILMREQDAHVLDRGDQVILDLLSPESSPTSTLEVMIVRCRIVAKGFITENAAKCGGKIFDTENSYICERSQTAKSPCKFRLSKTILGRDIPKEQAQKLITTGKTDLIDGFISKRGRPFSAYLKLEDGKVGFAFPEKIEASQRT